MSYGVVMPVHNEEKAVQRVLNSVLNQTLPPEKVVVVDDGSTDSTPEILKEYEKTAGINVIQKKLRFNDSSMNINHSVRLALEYMLKDPPPFILRVDGDSILLPYHAKACIHMLMAHPKVGITGGHSHTRRYNKKHQADASRMYRTEALLDALEGKPYPVQFASDSYVFFAVQWKGWEILPFPIPFIDLRPYKKTIYRSIMSGRWRKNIGIIFIDQLAKTRYEVQRKPYIVGALAEFLTYLLAPCDGLEISDAFRVWLNAWSKRRTVEFIHNVGDTIMQRTSV